MKFRLVESPHMPTDRNLTLSIPERNVSQYTCKVRNVRVVGCPLEHSEIRGKSLD